MINDGHVFVPESLGGRASELLEVSADLIAPPWSAWLRTIVFADMVPLNNTTAETGKSAVGEAAGVYGSSVIYLTPLYFGEKGVAERLKALVSAISRARVINRILFSDEQFSDEQRSAIQMALTHPVSVLTGGPGTGKTTCLKALITTLEAQGMKYALASPTGRAAKRLSEATGQRSTPFIVYWNTLPWRVSAQR